MSAPLTPSPLDYVGLRRFALYPAIKNIECNEWMLGLRSWSEVQVLNSRTGSHLWIPLQYIGGVSDRFDAVLVVELTKELELRAGALGPSVKCVIEMPQTVRERPMFSVHGERRAHGPASVVGIRTENRESSPMNKTLLTLGAGAIAVYLLAALISVLSRS